jgi:hypothetical protein
MTWIVIKREERKKYNSNKEKSRGSLVQNGQRQCKILSPDPQHSPFCQLQISEPEGRVSLTCLCDTSPTRLTRERPRFYGRRSSWCNSFSGTPRSFSLLPLPQRCAAYSLPAELMRYLFPVYCRSCPALQLKSNVPNPASAWGLRSPM